MSFISSNVIVSGLGGQHDQDVGASFIQGYESNGRTYNGTITYTTNSISATLANAGANKLVMRSTTGASGAISVANSYYPSILTVMPSGSNSFVQVYSGVIPDSLVLTGAGDLNNETGYKVEFFNPDTITIEPDLSSYANGYIGGQLMSIYDELNNTIGITDWSTIRQFIRDNASLDGVFSAVDGYGIINIAKTTTAYSNFVAIVYRMVVTANGYYKYENELVNEMVLTGNGIFKLYADLRGDKIVTKDGLIS